MANHHTWQLAIWDIAIKARSYLEFGGESIITEVIKGLGKYPLALYLDHQSI